MPSKSKVTTFAQDHEAAALTTGPLSGLPFPLVTAASGTVQNPTEALVFHVIPLAVWGGGGGGMNNPSLVVSSLRDILVGGINNVGTDVSVLPAVGGALARGVSSKTRQRSVDFNYQFASLNWFVPRGLGGSFDVARARVMVVAGQGYNSNNPGQQVLADNEFNFHGGTRAASMVTTVTETSARHKGSAFFADLWTIVILATGWHVAERGAQRHELTVTTICELPVRRG